MKHDPCGRRDPDTSRPHWWRRPRPPHRLRPGRHGDNLDKLARWRSLTATPEVGPQTLDCGEDGFINVGNAPLYGESLDDPNKAPSPREMADQFARRQRLASMFPEADLVAISVGKPARAWAWQEPDGTRRAYVAYKYVDSFGGWQSLGDAVCVPSALVSPSSEPH